VQRGVRRLVVAGGETSGAVVDHLGIPAFLVGPEIAAGVPVLRTIGGRGAMDQPHVGSSARERASQASQSPFTLRHTRLPVS
jgi:uncharacterized protein YgbK (DUF1537 family)